MKKTLTILVATSLLFGVACNKKEEAKVSETAQAVQEAALGDWDKAVVNSLLSHVPADSAMVLASTRAMDLDHPLMKRYLSKSEDLIKSLGDNELDALDKLYEPLIDLLKDYETLAPAWGLNPKGREDSIVYMTDSKFVIQSTLTDGQKTKVKLVEMLQAIEGLTVSDVEIDGKSWHLIGAKDDDTVKLAAYVGSRKLTVSLVFDATQDLSYLSDLLKPADKAISKDALGKLSDQTIGIGYMDSVKLFAQALNPSTDLGKLVVLSGEYEGSEVCTSEIASIAKKFPRIDFNGLIQDEAIRMDYIVKLGDKETIADLKSIVGKRLDIASAQSLGSLFLSLNVGKVIEVLSKWGNQISQDPYNCEDLSSLNDTATTLSGLPVITSGGAIKFVKSLGGLGLALESLELTGGMPKIEASAYILGPELISAAEALKTQDSDDAMLKAINTEKGKVGTIDLSEMVGLPIVVQTQFTDDSFVMTTGEGVDIAKVAAMKSIDTQDILSFSLDYKVLKQIKEDIDLDYVMEFSMGITDDGIRFTSIVKP